ncbi:MAG: cell division protein FtsZ [Saprospiraceae bacterium]|uniref:Cell division protein FtsZ n=1 Tax=Candidatus Opimibacter skivensis TaxID=2982028 RepID=A0A9D7XSK5_9BACT|nr:cell division protein FtsZ [Candidatus Opimibacter skivensis]
MLFDIPKVEKSIIKVLGVGGGGSNAVSYMYKQGISGVDFAICNTDNQAMETSLVPVKIRLGPELTGGRGAGSRPQMGKQACIESIDDIRDFILDGTKMLFVTAGMGGGTGTGAAPIIAKAAREADILTVGIVTLPFTFEGSRRKRQALEGLEEMKNNVDALIVISNDKLRDIHGDLKLSDAFSRADNILTTAARGIAEIITMPGYVNVDFEDVNTVMRDSGVAIMGTAMFDGEHRAKKAVQAALNSPLLEDNDIRGAQHILLNISSGRTEVTMDEIFEITEYVQAEAGYGTDLIWGNCIDESLGEKLSVTIIATGFEQNMTKPEKQDTQKILVGIDEDMMGMSAKTNDLDDMHISDERVMEFEPVISKETKELHPDKAKHTYNDPYVRADDVEKREEIRRTLKEKEAQRQREEQPAPQMNINPSRIQNSEWIAEMTKVPAFARRKIQLDVVPPASELKMSRLTVSDDDGDEVLKGNTYLYDKPC